METGIYWPSFFFLLFACVACGFALGVVLTSNIVHMAFYLIMALTAVAGLFFLAGADFVAAMQIMIYVGGTLVLLAFGVMLTSRAPFVSMRARSGEWVLAVLVGGLLLGTLLGAALAVDQWRGISRADARAQVARPTATRIGMSLLGVPTDRPAWQGQSGTAAGSSSRGGVGYLLPFEIVSVHLLVALVGAAYLARTRRRVAVEKDAVEPARGRRELS